jgi:hypothetical protein
MGEQDECEDMKGSKDRRGIEKRGGGGGGIDIKNAPSPPPHTLESEIGQLVFTPICLTQRGEGEIDY